MNKEESHLVFIYKKEKIDKALWVMKCPRCNRITSSASEKLYLPEKDICVKCSNKNLIK